MCAGVIHLFTVVVHPHDGGSVLFFPTHGVQVGGLAQNLRNTRLLFFRNYGIIVYLLLFAVVVVGC